jgi:hypothetical protein
MSNKQKSIIDQKSLAEVVGSVDKQGGLIIRIYFNSIDKDIQAELMDVPEGWQIFVGAIRPFMGSNDQKQYVGCEAMVFFLSGYQENPVELFHVQTVNTFSETNSSTSFARASYDISTDMVTDSDLPKLKLYMRRFYEKVSTIFKSNWASQVIEPLMKSNEQEAAPRPERAPKTEQAMAAMPAGIDDMDADTFPESQVPQMAGRPPNPAPQRAVAQRTAAQPQQQPQPQRSPKQAVVEKKAGREETDDGNKEVASDDDDLFGFDVPTIPRVNDGKDVPTLKGNALRSSK